MAQIQKNINHVTYLTKSKRTTEPLYKLTIDGCSPPETIHLVQYSPSIPQPKLCDSTGCYMAIISKNLLARFISAICAPQLHVFLCGASLV